MKKLVIALLLAVCSVYITEAQDKNTLRTGIGVNLYNPSNEKGHASWAAPSLFAEYGHRFSDYFSATATLNTDLRNLTDGRGDSRITLSLCGLVRPFAKTEYLDRLELGLGFNEEYIEYYGSVRRTFFNPWVDIPVKVYILDTSKYDLAIAQIFRLHNRPGERGGFKMYDSSIALMFGVKF
ncbi:MAG: hypothetical protein VZQ27_01075 [Candidatus Cryptobacteroides sp.]|nr:hypothetical protein [Candidatus Cryptobacteroides sp.]